MQCPAEILKNVQAIIRPMGYADDRLRFVFGDLSEFCLDIPKSYRGEKYVLKNRRRLRSVVEPRALDVLACLVSRPEEVLSDEEIALDVWGTERKADNNLERQISSLRAVLGDDAKNPRFIERIRGYGYKFLMPVKSEGEPSGKVDCWSNEEYFRFLRKTERIEGDREDDLRILTTAFSWGVTDSEIEPLLARKIRINIILMDPMSSLVLARNKLRLRTLSLEKASSNITDQVRELAELRAHYPTLGFRLSTAMPCGFVAHSRNGARLGVFLAQDSYTKGPMISISPNTKMWRTLHEDWKRRWADASLIPATA
jgi:DNA-binding winged helix-turn-helix (wHTH) protein